MDTIKLTIGYVVLRNGDPVKTGRCGAQTAKLYAHPGRARAVASGRKDTIVLPAFIEVPGE
jgi:hypothetical protein